ncbi:NUDIX domain-containing protein [Candidatus Woesearchaeota archaeon]|nr:NUDIX domain-containing protein [Candidatus Woesearchaeota archaeon]
MVGRTEQGTMNSVDILFEINNRYVLLGKRKNTPFKDHWALIGGRQEPYEKLSDAAIRILKQRMEMIVEAKASGIHTTLNFGEIDKEAILHQVRTYDSGTDPRGGNTTLFAIQLHVDKNKLLKALHARDNFSEIRLFEKKDLPKLAFDHGMFITQYFEHLRPYPKSEADYNARSYDRPSVTVDIIIFTIKDASLKVLLVKRKSWPFKDYWALPGGFVEMNESVDESAKRELEEETGVKDVYLEQLYTFGDPERDPRTRVISVAYFALVSSDKVTLKAASDASDAAWMDVESLPKLAFDHRKILDLALGRIRNKIEYTTIAFQLLPKKFTFSELQKVYEVILGKDLDKRNFRKKMKELGLLKELKEHRMDGPHRPAQLFSFKSA